MSWKVASSVFFLSMIKFMFAPFTGVGLSLSLFQTAIVCFCGAALSSCFFYFSSKYFMERARLKKLNATPAPKNMASALRKRKINKVIVKVKKSLGIYGLCYLAPLLLSIPVGTIICAKFYNHKSKTFPLIVFFLALNSFLLSTLAVAFF